MADPVVTVIDVMEKAPGRGAIKIADTLQVSSDELKAAFVAYLLLTTGVASVNGRSGAVVLDKTDVDLDAVDNTSDLAKPISTLVQAALDLKSPLNSPAFTGTPTAPTP